MARRKKSSPAQDLIELVAMLPWWVGVVLAPLSYLLLHPLATSPLTAPVQPGQGTVVTQTLWKGLASAGQYILPIIFLAAAGLSEWQRKVRRDLAADVAQSQASNAR